MRYLLPQNTLVSRKIHIIRKYIPCPHQMCPLIPHSALVLGKIHTIKNTPIVPIECIRYDQIVPAPIKCVLYYHRDHWYQEKFIS